MGWRGAIAGREVWELGKLQENKEEDGGKGRQEGTLTGTQAAKRRGKKNIKKGGREIDGKLGKHVHKSKGKQRAVREDMN